MIGGNLQCPNPAWGLDKRFGDTGAGHYNQGMSTETQTVEQRVKAVLARIRPAVQADDGDIELVGVTDEGVAQIRFHGTCVTCPSQSTTLQHDIEKNVKRLVPEITSVVAVA